MAELGVVSFGPGAEAADPGKVLPGTTIGADGQVSVPTDQQKAKEELKKAERPAWLPEKFKTEEDLAKAYLELEKKQGAPKKEALKSDDKAKTGDDPAKAVAAAGFDYQALETEYAENGDLTAETYKALADKGIPKEMVDGYIEGRKALGSRLVSGLLEVAGSEENVSEALEWAKEGVSAEEVAAYNKAVKSGDPVTAKILFHSIYSRFAESGGIEPVLKGGGAGKGTGGVQPFPSRAQMTKAMSSPEYKNDAGFRAEVERRVAVTDFSKLL